MNRLGDRVGPFELLEWIGSRPLVNVWKGQRIGIGTREPHPVVIRIAHHSMDSRAMSELRREYDALRTLNDPRVRKALGFYAGAGAVVLEYVEGVSLAGLLRSVAEGGASVDVATSVELAIELVGALRCAHEGGVVHGRLCADTVRLRPDGGVVLTDFALPVERLPVVPPELMQGLLPTAATDQWLVGALLVHLITGQPLLGGAVGNPTDGRRDLGAAIAAVAAVSPGVGRAISRMLATDPDDRYAADGSVLLELLAILRTIEAPPSRLRLARSGRSRPARVDPPPPPAPEIPAAGLAPRIRQRIDDAGAVAPPELTLPPTRGLPLTLTRPPRWIPTLPELVAAVHEEDATDIPLVETVIIVEPTPPPARFVSRRRVSDAVATLVLIVLLSVGAWAIFSRVIGP